MMDDESPLERRLPGVGEILRGWSAIVSASGGFCEPVLRRMARRTDEHRFPVQYVEGTPWTTREAIATWWASRPHEPY
jgi:hypothetical protein